MHRSQVTSKTKHLILGPGEINDLQLCACFGRCTTIKNKPVRVSERKGRWLCWFSIKLAHPKTNFIPKSILFSCLEIRAIIQNSRFWDRLNHKSQDVLDRDRNIAKEASCSRREIHEAEP